MRRAMHRRLCASTKCYLLSLALLIGEMRPWAMFARIVAGWPLAEARIVLECGGIALRWRKSAILCVNCRDKRKINVQGVCAKRCVCGGKVVGFVCGC